MRNAKRWESLLNALLGLASLMLKYRTDKIRKDIMDTNTIYITLIASLASGLLGSIGSAIFFRKLEKTKLKVDTARRLIGHRYNIQSAEFQLALNEIFVVFSNSKAVMKALEEFWQDAQLPPQQRTTAVSNDKLIKLLKSVCKDAGLETSELSEAFYLRFLRT
ncbi:hypothetical protein P3553_15730 [Vibrio parahaemolyticus]|nr:hypothetical protein [Vibrio parahaemolyticus]ODW54623.1 hypothetical protein BBL88_12070 [Vibrio parahaemolyticus]